MTCCQVECWHLELLLHASFLPRLVLCFSLACFLLLYHHVGCCHCLVEFCFLRRSDLSLPRLSIFGSFTPILLRLLENRLAEATKVYPKNKSLSVIARP